MSQERINKEQTTVRIKEFKNGWTASLDKAGAMYVAIVRNARGDIHDKMRCDDYRDACDYYRAFTAIAKNA